jgi:hypothetical protein
MKHAVAAVALAAGVALTPATASAGERAGNTALGAVAGLVVFGPIGAVAGAAVGYTAGKGIARDWGLDHSRPPRKVRHRYDR